MISARLIKSLMMLTIGISCFTNKSYAAAPQVTGITTGSSQSLVLTGTDFGQKAFPSPIKFSNSEAEPPDTLPSGWVNAGGGAVISANNSHSGRQSVMFDCTNVQGEKFTRIATDLGSGTDVSTVYVSAWVYLDLTGNTANGFNWKGPILSSATNYYWKSGVTQDTASGFAGFYSVEGTYYGLNYTNRWFGTATTQQYSDGTNAVYSYGNSASWPGDAFVMGQWQRVEWIWKSSSAPSVADSTVVVNRIGRSGGQQILNSTGLISHGPDNKRWRYVSIPQGITNVNSGTLNFKMYFDDVYIDNTKARVEICDTSSWAARTHCEVQIPTDWSSSITVRANYGSFLPGQSAYVYVVDTNGLVSNGFPMTIPANQPAPPPNVRGTLRQ